MFSTNKFVKIWFSKPEGHPLGRSLNEYRLWSHRLRFPKDEINLVSNYEDFNEAGQQYIKAFCEKWNIKLISLNVVAEEIQAHIKKIEDSIEVLQAKKAKTKKNNDKLAIEHEIKELQCKIEDLGKQLKLLEISKLEITEEFGCLAAASDIVRILSPVARLGIYTDFDVIKKESSKHELQAPMGVLLDGDFFVNEYEQVEFTQLCNNNFVCDERISGFLRFYRALMLQRYTESKEVNQLLKAFAPKKIFDTNEYNNTCLFMKSNIEQLKQYSYAMRFRCALKQHATPENYEKFLKTFVLEVSGPACMHDAFNNYFNKEFVDYCKRNKVHGNKMARLFCTFRLDYPCVNEDDVSWLRADDVTAQRFEKIEQSTMLLQSGFRRYLAKLKLEALNTELKAALAMAPATKVAETSADLAAVNDKFQFN